MRGNNIYFRLISLFKIDFAKSLELDFAFQCYPLGTIRGEPSARQAHAIESILETTVISRAN